MTIIEFAEIWSLWAFVPILVALLVSLFRYNELNLSQRRISYLVAISLAVQFLSSIFWNLEWNNLPLLHLYTPIEFLILTSFYTSIEVRDKVKHLMWGVAGLLTLGAILNVMLFQNIYEFNTLVRGAESLLLIFFSIRTWVNIMKELKIERLTAAPVFWFNSAVLIYFSVNFILFLFNNQLNNLPEEVVLLPWLVHAFFMIIYYMLLTVGLWKK